MTGPSPAVLPEPPPEDLALHDPRDGQCKHSGRRDQSYPGYRCPICRNPPAVPAESDEYEHRQALEALGVLAPEPELPPNVLLLVAFGNTYYRIAQGDVEEVRVTKGVTPAGWTFMGPTARPKTTKMQHNQAKISNPDYVEGWNDGYRSATEEHHE